MSDSPLKAVANILATSRILSYRTLLDLWAQRSCKVKQPVVPHLFHAKVAFLIAAAARLNGKLVGARGVLARCRPDGAKKCIVMWWVCAEGESEPAHSV